MFRRVVALYCSSGYGLHKEPYSVSWPYETHRSWTHNLGWWDSLSWSESESNSVSWSRFFPASNIHPDP